MNRLFPRVPRGTVCQDDLTRLGLTVSTKTILTAADHARDSLRDELGRDAATTALAVALGRLCAESGLSLAEAVALVEITHREAVAEAEVVRGAA